jgi:hypothetical protein
MFDWFKGKNKLPSNVVPFPTANYGASNPYVEPPAPKKDPKTNYTFGLTDDNRMTFAMGYTTLVMTYEGVEQLIKQLEFFKNQLYQEQDEQS